MKVLEETKVEAQELLASGVKKGLSSEDLNAIVDYVGFEKVKDNQTVKDYYETAGKTFKLAEGDVKFFGGLINQTADLQKAAFVAATEAQRTFFSRS